MALRISTLDIFRKIPRDLTQATGHGGALSILAIFVLASVLILELWDYMAGETRSKLVLDQNADSKLQVNFAISFPELPCRFASVETWNYLGNSKLDINGEVERIVVSGNYGTELRESFEHEGIQHAQGDPNYNDASSDYVIDIDQSHFATKLKESDFTFVMFYVDWCMFCKLALPIWHDLGKAVADRGSFGANRAVQIARVDCEAQSELCTSSKIAGYPTFMMFRGLSPLDKGYHGHRNVHAFLQFIEQTVGMDESEGVQLKHQWHEGCLLKGHLEVPRVPGNFHVTAKSDGHNFDLKSTNTSHIVHELSFGPRLHPRMLKKLPDDVRRHIDPLAGRHFVNHYGHKSHEHHIKVVSTVYEGGTIVHSSGVSGYQMSASNNQFDSDPNVPEARFSYDLAPTAVVISQAGRRWYEFVTTLCGILGGTFTVFSLFNGLIGSVKQKVSARDREELLSPSSAGPR